MVNISELWLKLVLGFGYDGSGFGSGGSREEEQEKEWRFWCGLLWVFDDFVGFEKMGALGFMNFYLR